MPDDGVLVPLEGVSVPGDGVSVSLGGVLEPDDGVLVPLEGVSVPDDGVLVPLEGVLVPDDGSSDTAPFIAIVSSLFSGKSVSTTSVICGATEQLSSSTIQMSNVEINFFILNLLYSF